MATFGPTTKSRRYPIGTLYVTTFGSTVPPSDHSYIRSEGLTWQGGPPPKGDPHPTRLGTSTSLIPNTDGPTPEFRLIRVGGIITLLRGEVGK